MGRIAPSRIRPADAAAELARRDGVVKKLLAAHGPPTLSRPAPAASRFAALAETIVYQQLAGKAAASIYGRVMDRLGGEMTPKTVLGAGPSQLRAGGLSAAKAAALLDLADKVASGELRLERIGRLGDDEVAAELVRVKGIGPWTADMFLIFTLGRLDVWPVGDYGVRVGFARAWKLPEVPSPAALVVLGDPFKPYRSIVAWYCWRAAEQR